VRILQVAEPQVAHVATSCSAVVSRRQDRERLAGSGLDQREGHRVALIEDEIAHFTQQPHRRLLHAAEPAERLDGGQQPRGAVVDQAQVALILEPGAGDPRGRAPMLSGRHGRRHRLPRPRHDHRPRDGHPGPGRGRSGTDNRDHVDLEQAAGPLGVGGGVRDGEGWREAMR
jgi:hypothetical protein